MASSTPMGTAETSSNGNSGNPSTSVKPTNANAANIRKFSPASTKVAQEPVSQTTVTSPNNGMASPSVAASTSMGVTAETPSDYANDRYRRSREIEEPLVDTPASIRISTVGTNSDLVSAYSNFMLQAVSEAEQEKYQVVETFTAYYAFFYGKRPPVYNYSGILLNDDKQNWSGTFKYMYENYFRGTATAEFGAQAYISYRNKVISGFILNLNMQEDAMNPNGVPFTFSMLVISHTLTKFSDDFEKFIKQQEENLAALRSKADADIKQLNNSPDSIQQLLKMNILNGKRPTVSTKKKASPEDADPINYKALSTLGDIQPVTQLALDSIKPVTGNNILLVK